MRLSQFAAVLLISWTGAVAFASPDDGWARTSFAGENVAASGLYLLHLLAVWDALILWT